MNYYFFIFLLSIHCLIFNICCINNKPYNKQKIIQTLIFWTRRNRMSFITILDIYILIYIFTERFSFEEFQIHKSKFIIYFFNVLNNQFEHLSVFRIIDCWLLCKKQRIPNNLFDSIFNLNWLYYNFDLT